VTSFPWDGGVFQQLEFRFKIGSALYLLDFFVQSIPAVLSHLAAKGRGSEAAPSSMDEFDRVETPENVMLKRRLAGIGSRTIAGLIDNFLILAVI